MKLTRRNMEHEVVVDDVILRVFNRKPDTFIQRDFGLFMEALLSKLSE